MTQGRTKVGTFANKSDAERHVRSIRATNQTWESFGRAADERGITRADLLELLVQDHRWDTLTEPDITLLSDVIQILEEALRLKANSGGAIKAKVREALILLQAHS